MHRPNGKEQMDRLFAGSPPSVECGVLRWTVAKAIEAGMPVRRASRLFGISRTTARKWWMQCYPSSPPKARTTKVNADKHAARTLNRRAMLVAELAAERRALERELGRGEA